MRVYVVRLLQLNVPVWANSQGPEATVAQSRAMLYVGKLSRTDSFRILACWSEKKNSGGLASF